MPLRTQLRPLPTYSGRIYRLQLDRFNNGKLSTQWAGGATGIGPLVKTHCRKWNPSQGSGLGIDRLLQ